MSAIDAASVRTRKKLIEVALPLDAINTAAAREKSIRHGHPSTLHLWWARRPLAAARAVIFAQMVDDPSEHTDTLLSDPERRRRAQRELTKRHAVWEQAQTAFDAAQSVGDESVPEPGPEPTLGDVAAEQERDRLFALITELVQWENTTNEDVLQRARDEIWQSWRVACADNADHPRAAELFDRHRLPAFHDPFAGGGALPLEAQRLGLEAYASDLNPVAVLINKAMIEIPPNFAGHPPVNPEARLQTGQQALQARQWRGAQGLADDVRYYGQWMRDEAEKRIGHLYPMIEITQEVVAERPDLAKFQGQNLTVIAWLWARTVKSPNPAFAHVDVPLASTFMLSTKAGKEAYVEPVIEGDNYRFTVRTGKARDAKETTNGTKLDGGANFRCLLSNTPISTSYIKSEAQDGRMGYRMLAMVAEAGGSRVYLAPTEGMEHVARAAEPDWAPDVEFFQKALGFAIGSYGMTQWSDLFTPRQLAALSTFANLVGEARQQVLADGLAYTHSFSTHVGQATSEASSVTAYADAVATYLGFGVSKVLNTLCSLVKWNSGRDQTVAVFARQALSIMWDFADVNPFAGAAGDLALSCQSAAKCIEKLPASIPGRAYQADAVGQSLSLTKVISTDPPYYDNVGYADLSDYFYVWLRQMFRDIFPDLFATVVVPKASELVATPHRHGGRSAARRFFLEGMTAATESIARQTHPAFPVTIYYAFKQSESEDGEARNNTGWETFLEAVTSVGLAITGTWPVRTERTARPRQNESNALASSIVLVCRPLPASAPTATRREFVNELRIKLPRALIDMQRGNIAPVDLAQAAIGPGMAVFTRYREVIDAEGNPLSVRQALALINQVLDEVQAAQEGDFDAETRWAITWFDQEGFAEGEYGMAEVLATGKNTAVSGMVEAGIVASARGKVRLLRPLELDPHWDPLTDYRRTVWELTHHLIRVLETVGEGAAAELAARIGAQAEAARELAYRLYTISERKKRAADALAYNSLVQSWPEITRLAQERRPVEQSGLL